MTGSQSGKAGGLGPKDSAALALAVVGAVAAVVGQYYLHGIGVVVLVLGIAAVLVGVIWLLIARQTKVLIVAVVLLVVSTGTFFIGRYIAPVHQVQSATPPVAVAEMNASLVSFNLPGDSHVVSFTPTVPAGSTTLPEISAPFDITVNGDVVNIDSKHDLWVLDAQEDTTHYYIHQGPCALDQGKGRFYCKEILVGRQGQDVHSRWQLFVVRTTKAQTAKWIQQMAGGDFNVNGLPGDVFRLDTKSVVRS
jgi:disulfide bond formation protein DsbB